MVDLFYGAARLLAFAALALLIGAALFLAAWWPGGAHYPGVRRLIWSSWVMLVTSTVAVLVLFGPQVAQRPLGSVVEPELLSTTLDTQVGSAMLIRLVVLSLAAPGLALLLSRTQIPTPRHRRWRVGGVLGGAAALSVTWSIAGHSATGAQAAIAIPVDVMHLVAMGVWLGGLVVLCGVLLRTKEVVAMRTAVPSFSRAALVCVVVLAVTGGYQGWRQVGSPAALVTTSYGWLLLGKVLLVILLVGIGAFSRSWVRRHYTDAGPAASSISARRAARHGPGRQEIGRFRRMVVVEAVLAAFVLGVTAVLVSSQPARTARIEALAQQPAAQVQAATTGWTSKPATARFPFDAGGPSGQGLVDVAVTPAKVGDNQAHMSILDTAGNLKDAAEVTATLSLADRAMGPLPVRLQKLALGHYLGYLAIPMVGQWQLVVTVRTSEVDQDTITTPIDVW